MLLATEEQQLNQPAKMHQKQVSKQLQHDEPMMASSAVHYPSYLGAVIRERIRNKTNGNESTKKDSTVI